jgi:hypothetical protein
MSDLRIILVGRISAGQEIDWRIAPLPDRGSAIGAEREENVIDYGQELQELLDARLDEEYWRSGQW